MNIYLLIFIILAFFSFLSSKSKGARGLLLLTFFFLFFFAGLRGEGIGFDYDNYVDNIFKSDNLPFIEPGNMLLAGLLRPIGSVTLYFMTYAMVAVATKTLMIRRCSNYPILSVLMYFSIYFLVQDMGQIRYGLAVGICTFALISIANGDKKRFWVLVLLASMFHFSALIVIPAYFIRKIQFTPVVLYVLLIFGSAFVILDFSDIMYRILELMPIEGISYRAAYYMVAEEDNGAFGFNMSLLMRLCVLFVFYTYQKKHTSDKYFNTMFNFFLYGVISYCILNFNQEFASRGSGYFKFLEVILIPYVIYHIKRPQIRVVSIFFVIAYSFYSMAKIIYTPGTMGQYVPYKIVLF